MFYLPTSHPPESPPIVCENSGLELPHLLKELQKMAQALLPGDRLRLVTDQPDTLPAILAWCQASGNKIIQQTEQRSLMGNGMSQVCITEYIFDIERGEG
jgi:TusA-related sulfurtransferase